MSVGIRAIGEHGSPGSAARKAQRRAFLALLERGEPVRAALRQCGWSGTDAYRRRRSCPRFRRAWDRAVKAGVLAVEAEGRRRAVEGWDEVTVELVTRPASGKGPDGEPLPDAVVYRKEKTVHRRSDSLLLAYLKAHHDAYRDRQELVHTTAPLVDPELQRAVLADPVASQLACDLAARIASLRQQAQPLPLPPPDEPSP
jgi:hypothetical protein